jgi:hypothetical protein
MEDILAIILIFGGGTIAALSFSPVGRALADRIRHGGAVPGGETDPAIYEELDRPRQELGELQERVDFTERLLAKKKEAGQIEGGSA